MVAYSGVYRLQIVMVGIGDDEVASKLAELKRSRRETSLQKKFQYPDTARSRLPFSLANLPLGCCLAPVKSTQQKKRGERC